jgi:hypothetical protein
MCPNRAYGVADKNALTAWLFGRLFVGWLCFGWCATASIFCVDSFPSFCGYICIGSHMHCPNIVCIVWRNSVYDTATSVGSTVDANLRVLGFFSCICWLAGSIVYKCGAMTVTNAEEKGAWIL